MNYRLIQSSHGTSLDQTNHIIQNILHVYFGPGEQDVPLVSSPFPLDSKIEVQLFEELPLSEEELQQLETKHKGSLSSWTGALQHVSRESRLDIYYSAMRLSGYNAAPKRLCFIILDKLMCYIYHHPHIPLMYSSKRTDMTTIESHFHKGEAEIKNIHSYSGLVNSGDSDLARDLVDRRSVASIIHEFNNTAFAWKCNKHTETSTGSNGAETRTLFQCTKDTKRYRRFLESIVRPLDHPTPTHEDNEATITQVIKDRLTPEVKHLDVMICWLNEQYRNRTFQPIPTSTKNMRADLNTKPHGGESLQIKSLPLFGIKFYPPPDSEHYKLLELDKYNIGYHRGSFLRTNTKKGDNNITN